VRSDLEPLTDSEASLYDNALKKRVAGPSGGSSHPYTIYEYPRTATSSGFRFVTPTYPNGNNGGGLDAENGMS
jgi:hypothetical protein